VWQKTTQPHAVWDKPVFEEFFQAVRAVNATLSRERQLRVLLGDPPVDWDNMHSREDLSKWMTNPLADRDRYPADVIKREVLAKHRRALLIYGATFLQRKSLGANYEMSQDWGNTIVSLLEREASMKLFTIWTHSVWDLETLQGGAGSWPVPSLAMLRGTVLGAKDFTAYVPAQTAADRVSRQDGNFVPIPSNQWRSMRMEDQFDALLYLGPPSAFTFSPQSPGLCSDPDYMEMRLRHMGLAGLPQAQADRLKQTCATQAPR
jgi:hypothetical protein